MDYQEFLQRSGERDSPSLRQAFEKQFGGSPPAFDFASGSRIGERSSPGKVWGVPSGHASLAGQGGMTEEYAQEVERRNFPLPGDYEAPNLGLSPPNEAPPLESPWGTGVDRGMSGMDEYQGPADYDAYKQYLNEELTHEGGTSVPFQGGGLIGGDTLVNPWDMQVGGTDKFPARPSGIETAPFPYASSSFFEGSPSSGLLTKAPDFSDADLKALGMKTGLSTNEALAKAYPLDYAAGSEYAAESAQALEAAEAGVGAADAWGGPATFAANQALNMIPTRDRDKKVTPLGDQGSVSGILKGTGKGALLGATIGSAFPVVGTGVGAVVGGAAGLIGGAQGYFDSTSAPIMNMSRIKRRGGGMQGGLLGGGSFYG